MDADGGEIQPERHSQRLDWGEVSVADRLRERVLIRKRLEVLAQITHVAAVRRSSDAEDVRRPEVGQNTLIAVRKTVVCLVDDDGAEIVGGEAVKPRLSLQALNAADGHAIPGPEAAAFRFFERGYQSGRFVELVRSLVKQLTAVSEDQHAVAALYGFLGYGRKDDCFSGTCW